MVVGKRRNRRCRPYPSVVSLRMCVIVCGSCLCCLFAPIFILLFRAHAICDCASNAHAWATKFKRRGAGVKVDALERNIFNI